MWIVLFLILSALAAWGIIALVKWSSAVPEPTQKSSAKPVTNNQRRKKERKYLSEDFKIPKKIKDGEKINLYPILNSEKVNFYEDNSYGGEGFLHKEINRNLWKIVEENRYTSTKIIRTEKNMGYVEIKYY